MSIGIQRQRATFAPHTGGPQSMDLSFTFGSIIASAFPALGGFDIGFSDDDHHLLRTQVDTTLISLNGPTAVVRVTFSIRDNSGNFDDPFSGFVDVVMIADLA